MCDLERFSKIQSQLVFAMAASYMYGTAQRQRRTRCSSRARLALALDSSLQACN